MFPDPRLILAGFLAGFVVVTGWLTLTARTHAVASARGAFTEPTDQADWRGFLFRAALRRADELNRLRDLSDTPVRQEQEPPAAGEPAQPEPKVSNLPDGAPDVVPEETPSNPIVETPTITMPVDIGETSTIELPVTLPTEPPLPPVQQIKPTTAAGPGQKTVRKHRKRRPKTQTAANANASVPNLPPNPFLWLFGGGSTSHFAAASATTAGQPASPFGHAAVQPSSRPIGGPTP